MKSSFISKNSITSIAIGGFDGMHIAHQELFSNLDENGAIVVIETGYANLTPKTNRQQYSKYPISYYPLENIKHLQGKEFINLLLEEFPNLKKIVVGYDFCFGANRKYCINELKEFFSGNVVVIEEIKLGNIDIHSRVIRNYLNNGEILTANSLLGKEYKISGTKIKGQGLGKKEFVPTINLRIDDFLVPKEGIYATKTILGNDEFISVTFIGHRVTTDNSYAIETHIIDSRERLDTLKINKVEIKFFDKIRENKKFDSFKKLKQQILTDIEDTKKVFKNLL